MFKNVWLSTIIWKELKRQRCLKYILLIQSILIIVFLINKISTFNVVKFWIYIPLLFTFVTQNDIFFYDLTSCMEVLLATPIMIKDLLKCKSVFVVVKSYVFSFIFFIPYTVFREMTGNKINYFKVEYLIVICLFVFTQYYFSIFIGKVVWKVGKKSRFIICIYQSVIYLLLNIFFNQYETIRIVLFLIILTVILYFFGAFKHVSKEELIKRSV